MSPCLLVLYFLLTSEFCKKPCRHSIFNLPSAACRSSAAMHNSSFLINPQYTAAAAAVVADAAAAAAVAVQH